MNVRESPNSPPPPAPPPLPPSEPAAASAAAGSAAAAAVRSGCSAEKRKDNSSAASAAGGPFLAAGEGDGGCGWLIGGDEGAAPPVPLATFASGSSSPGGGGGGSRLGRSSGRPPPAGESEAAGDGSGVPPVAIGQFAAANSSGGDGGGRRCGRSGADRGVCIAARREANLPPRSAARSPQSLFWDWAPAAPSTDGAKQGQLFLGKSVVTLSYFQHSLATAPVELLWRGGAPNRGRPPRPAAVRNSGSGSGRSPGVVAAAPARARAEGRLRARVDRPTSAADHSCLERAAGSSMAVVPTFLCARRGWEERRVNGWGAKHLSEPRTPRLAIPVHSPHTRAAPRGKLLPPLAAMSSPGAC